MRLKGFSLSFAAALTFFLMVGGAYWFLSSSNPSPSYKEVKLQKRAIRITIQATGNVEALNRVDILPAVPGRVDKILVREGDQVRASQIIAWMSSTNRAALLDLARTKSGRESKDWESMYEPTPVLAPVEGLITKKNVVPGQMVNAASILFSMSDRLIVRAQVDETDIAKISENMEAEVTLDAYPGEVFPGKVHLIGHDSQLVNSVNVYLVEVWPEKAPEFLRSGMTANVAFIEKVKENSLTLPVWSVNGKENETVTLLGSDHRPAQVRLGASDGTFVEVLSDLAEGAKFLIKPFEMRLETHNDPFSLKNSKRKNTRH